MIKHFLIITVLILSGCSNLGEKIKDAHIINSGLWRGKIEQITTKNLNDEKKGNGVYHVMISACAFMPEFWISADGSEFIKLELPYNVKYQLGGSIFYSITGEKSWVEMQSWSIANIDENTISVQWSRLVSNPTLKTSEELRSFGQMGYGTLNKVNDDCNLVQTKS